MAPQYESGKVAKIWKQKWLNGMQMVQFDYPRHWKPSLSFSFGVGGIPIFHYWPSGVIRNGSPVWKWKRWKIFSTKWAEWTANGPVWMPQASKSYSPIQFWSWVKFTFPLLALWGNKKLLPSMKVKKTGKIQKQNGPNGLQMVQLECHRPLNLLHPSNSGAGWILFSHY